jgi:hypothetical protein
VSRSDTNNFTFCPALPLTVISGKPARFWPMSQTNAALSMEWAVFAEALSMESAKMS